MPFLIIITVLFLVIIIISIIVPITKKAGYEDSLKNELEKNKIAYNIHKAEHFSYNFILEINKRKFLIKLVSLPSYSLVQINNKTTWEIKYGGRNNPGKSDPYSKYLNLNIDCFMKLETKEDEQEVVVLIPKSKKIVMYINECEIVFVKPNTNVYGTRIINCDDFSIFKEE